MVRLYSRCNSGHYFEGEHCPLDGWSSPASAEIAAALDRLREEGTRPSIEALRGLGVSKEAIRRCIVVEFGDAEAAFELVAPEGYMVGGHWVPSKDFDERYT
jgi:hypothetical protein